MCTYALPSLIYTDLVNIIFYSTEKNVPLAFQIVHHSAFFGIKQQITVWKWGHRNSTIFLVLFYTMWFLMRQTIQN